MTTEVREKQGQLVGDDLPPAQDLKELIKQEHIRAELQRLDEGMDGCGCSDCQGLYKTLDLTKYGSRVINIGGVVLVREKMMKKSVATIDDVDDTLQTASLIVPPTKKGVSKLVVDKLLLPTQKDSKKRVAMIHPGGRPRKKGGVSRTTLWRRGKAEQGVLV